MRIALVALLSMACSSSPATSEAPQPAPTTTVADPEPAPDPEPEPTTTAPDTSTLEGRKAVAERMLVVFDALAGAVTSTETDCVAMAIQIDGIGTTYAADIEAAKNIQDDKEIEAWFKETHAKKLEELARRAMESMMKNCAQDEAVGEAFKKLFG